MNITAFISLMIATFLILLLFVFINKTNSKSQMKSAFNFAIICLLICCVGQILQITFSNLYNIHPIYFDYFVYIGTCFLPIAFLFIALIFVNTKIKFTRKYLLLFVIPVLSIILLWTNNYHHLFYKVYSLNMNATIVGFYFYIHSYYTLLLYLIALVMLIKYSIKNSGFFSKQAILIFIGSLVPIITNLLGFLGIISMSIYITPITFALTILCLAFAIFKFDFLKITPIALQRIVDSISDSYIIINEDNVITDFNQTLLNTFKLYSNDLRNKNLFKLIQTNNYLNINITNLKNSIAEIKNSDKTIVIEEHFNKIDKDFHIEINRIENKGNFLGTLILSKDITQHVKDMQTIKDNQDMLIEKERLASLGQMIGGIAHNLKTPIMSIAGATEGLSDLIKEYDLSISDKEVTPEDHHEIAKDMSEWIEKIKIHLSYMSDVITAIKGQAVAFSEQTANGFTIKEVINYVNILMKHELQSALINLKIQSDIDTTTVLKGNINSLVQVINNILSNSIQAYQAQGKTNEGINFTIYKKNNYIIFKIEDLAGGLPKSVQDKLFKKMVTTKGKHGTGLGLFMSYSNIKAHFSGNLRYETEEGKGTTFFIEIPL